MIYAHAESERVQQLQQNGYSDAQLYDPTETSVRGIHAFFLILGEPEAYGLPPKPQIPTIYLKSAWVPRATAIASSSNAPGVRVFHDEKSRRSGSARVWRAGERVLAIANFHRDSRFQNTVSARRRNQHARRARSPDRLCLTNRSIQLREEAWAKGVVTGGGVDVAGGPIPRKPGYYGQPVVRPPVWTWEIPVYFFVGGLGGMSAVIAFGAALFHHLDVVRTAMWVAAIASELLSPVLLILDLGRPHLFINMLRVFKPQSAMSMGAWILAGIRNVRRTGLNRVRTSRIPCIQRRN